MRQLFLRSAEKKRGFSFLEKMPKKNCEKWGNFLFTERALL
jgi:hypothetical protein